LSFLARTIYWVGSTPQPNKQFFSIYWFLQCIIPYWLIHLSIRFFFCLR